MSSDAKTVLQLGRALADALDPSDVIGRWMSHHLAELVTRCEHNPDDQELAATTRDVVLKLWEHKAGAPFRTKPLRYVQPVLSAIARLDPNPVPRAFYRPFDEEPPSADALSTYPLLRTACDIDREIGQLIRLSVAITAQQAISCEEPWVIAGKETAQTEEDRAVRALEQLVRRLRLPPEPVPSDDPDPASHSEPTADEQLTGEPTTLGAPGSDTGETLDSMDPLTIALQSAIVRSRRLLDQLAGLYDVAVIDGEGTQNGSGADEE